MVLAIKIAVVKAVVLLIAVAVVILMAVILVGISLEEVYTWLKIEV